MTAKDLRSLLYDVPDNSEIVILNENAPIKGAVPVYQTFTFNIIYNKNSPTSAGSEMNCRSEHKCSKEFYK